MAFWKLLVLLASIYGKLPVVLAVFKVRENFQASEVNAIITSKQEMPVEGAKTDRKSFLGNIK